MTLEAAAAERQVSATLVCPSCGAELSPGPDDGDQRSLTCATGHTFPIVRGVPRFVASEDYAQSFGVEWQRFPRVQLDSYNGTKISWTRFKTLTGLEPSELKGKRVLEAGCGPGRFLELVVKAGADAYGVDLSVAADVAHENLGSYPNCTVVQADIFRLPFHENHFDLVYSIGVLHHTPDPEAAFRRLVQHVKPGGRISIWVYGLGVSSGIRVRWIPRPYQLYGPFFRLLPPKPRVKALNAFTRFALAAGSLPLAGRLLKYIFWIDDLRRATPLTGGWEEGGGDPGKREKIRLEWAQASAFDAYTTKYTAQTPHDEVVRWARDAGLVNIEKSVIQSAITATKPA